MKVWVLTSEHNEYDQYGEYFLKVFGAKPTQEELLEVLKIQPYYNLANIDGILNGGGRSADLEEIWYFLREHEL